MTDLLLLPYHQDERLDTASFPLPADVDVDTVGPTLPDEGRWQRLIALYGTYADRVAALAARGPVRTMTGDCLATVGTMAGLQRAGLDPAIIWFDAHGDVHTLASSESGYLGGLALRMVLGGDGARLGEPLGLRPLPEERAVLVDARDLDPAEEQFLAGSDIVQTTVEAVAPSDLPDGPLLLHVDLDVVDPAEVPGLRFPAPDGPTRARVAQALQRVVDTGRVVAFDIACPWHVVQDPGDVERRAVVLEALLAIDLA